MDWIFLSAAAGFGLLWGSFLNVVIYRLPKTDIAGLRQRTPYTLTYLAFPLSFCPRCKESIAPWCNIPVLSYLLLGAKSKCCREPISWVYPVIELCGAGMFVLAFLLSDGLLNALLAIVFMSLLLVNAAIDWQRFYLLDIITYPLLWIGLVANIDARFALLSDAVWGAAGGYVVMAVFSWIFSRLIGQRAMGMGDYKLFAALGAWLGWQLLPMVLFLAAITAVIFGGCRRLIRGRGRHVPFGPSLSLAGVLMLFFGEEIMLAYWKFILQ
ncbi:MAG: A24 family peptidase [Proteobacteria bacterium]|nr:A24 family peptidase [Pseudomonadota bacterium]